MIVGLENGGAELMLERLILAHSRDTGTEHSVISLTTIGPIGARLRHRGIGVEAMAMSSPFSAPLVLWRLIRKFRGSKPDIVQTWMYHADLLGGVAARLAGITRVIWGIRTTDVAKGRSRMTTLVRWLCARLSHRVPHTIVCAADAARRLHVSLGYCSSRFVVVPNGIDTTRFQPSGAAGDAVRRECGFSENDLLVGSVGRFNVVKDQQNFVRAAGLVAREHPAASFLMVGRGCEPGNKELTSWIAQCGCTGRVVLLGERADTPACLAAMDIFALSSRTEGFPNVLAEAMAVGLACVTTDVGDAAYVLGNCGEIVPAGDSDALAQAVARLIAIPTESRQALGRAAKTRVEEEFSMERCVAHFAAIYAKTLTGNRFCQCVD